MKFTTVFSALIALLLGFSCKSPSVITSAVSPPPTIEVKPDSVVLLPPDTIEISVSKLLDSVESVIRIGTFLGSEQRNYYGNLAPNSLQVLWKLNIGTGKTKVGSSIREWSGAGWTGQPLMVEENGNKYIIQGAYDYSVRKIEESTQNILWTYKFDDVVKGTGTLWYNKKERDEGKKIMLFQGSRKGFDKAFRDKIIPSYRALSYYSGAELWRLNSRLTQSYSRDVDASALLVQDTLYIGLENGLFTVLNPTDADTLDGILQPKILQEHWLYTKNDVKAHRYNVVTEASPSKIGNHIYLASGSGHVYGYNMDTDSIDWDFFIGSDIDGTAVVTADSCLIISVEKQYIEGKGGALKLDPSKSPDKSVVWYQPVEDREFAGWEGGIIGTVGTNEATKADDWPSFAAIAALDGFLYIVNSEEFQKNASGSFKLGPGFNGKTRYPLPKFVTKIKIGASISTPIFVKDKLIVAGYGGIYLFAYDKSGNFELLDKFNATFESTPIAIDGRIYIASRDGNLYCFGDE